MANKMIIMIGVPGSGKSFKARQLLHDSPHGVILSTDDIFTAQLHYLWSREAIGIAHKINQEKARVACSRGISPVIIDNTNIQEWERKPYRDIAEEFNYEVVYCEADSPWKDDPVECHKMCSHNVPLETIKKMFERMEKC